MTTAAASRAERAAVRGRAGSQRSLEVLPQRRGRAKARVRGYLVDGLIGRFQQPLRQREPLSAPALAGIAYSVAWIASQLTGGRNPSISAPGTQLVASFAGDGGSMLAMFVLAEGVAAIALILVVIFVARAARQPGTRLAARRAATAAAGFGIASAVVSLTELGLGIWLFGTLLPQRRTATFGTAFHALNRLDGGKMFVLAAMAVALSAVALSAPILPRWLAPFGFLLGAALVVSGLGWLLLAPGLANLVNVSAPLLLAFVTATGVTLGLRTSGPAPQ